MARGINKVILIGNVGVDPEVRYMQNGNPVSTISVATSETWKDKQTNEKQERTEWHRVACFNKLAEIVKDYVTKGSKLYVEGSLRTRKWQDAQGQDRYTTEIIASDIQMLDRQGQGGSNFENDSYNQESPASQSKNQATKNSAPTSHAPQEEFAGIEDDIPF